MDREIEQNKFTPLELQAIFAPKRTSDKMFFYHGECIDGAASLWTAVNKYKDEMKYVPLLHLDVETMKEQILPHITPDSEVTFADFAPAPAVMDAILEKMEGGKGKVKVIDHHQTAIKEYEGYPKRPNLELVFDRTRSGGRMTYDEINNGGAQTPYEELPRIIKIAEALDLNQKDFENFAPISSYVDDFELSSPHRSYLVARMVHTMTMEKMLKKGDLRHVHETAKISKLMQTQSGLIDLSISQVSDKPLKVVIVPARLKDFSRHFDNELIAYTQEMDADLGMSYYIDDGLVRVSIRRPNDDIDLSVVGEALASRGKGGGGRGAAAAARFSPAQFTKVFGFAPVGYTNISARKDQARFVLASGVIAEKEAEREAKKRIADATKSGKFVRLSEIVTDNDKKPLAPAEKTSPVVVRAAADIKKKSNG